MAWTDKERAVRGEHHYMVIARLKPGVELQQAKAEMNTISDRLQQLYPDDDKGWGATVLPLHDDMVSDVRTPLLVLLGAVAFVLADCLRERGQSGAGKDVQPSKRDCDSHGAGRELAARAPPTPH